MTTHAQETARRTIARQALATALDDARRSLGKPRKSFLARILGRQA